MSVIFLPARFVIEGRPVSQKNRKIIARNRKTRIPFLLSSPEVRAWKLEAVAQLKSQWRGAHPVEGELRAEIVVYQGERQSIDVDNAASGAFDALQAAKIVKNDYQFTELRISRLRDRDRPRYEILIEPV